MTKTYQVDRGPLTINNIPPQRKELDGDGNVQTIPAGSVWFNAQGLYSTDNPAEQLWLEKHPEVRVVA